MDWNQLRHLTYHLPTGTLVIGVISSIGHGYTSKKKKECRPIHSEFGSIHSQSGLIHVYQHDSVASITSKIHIQKNKRHGNLDRNYA